MPNSTQGPSKTPASTEDMIEMLNGNPISKRTSLRTQVLKKNASTRIPLDKKAVHGLLARLKKKPSTDSKAFESVSTNSHKKGCR